MRRRLRTRGRRGSATPRPFAARGAPCAWTSAIRARECAVPGNRSGYPLSPTLSIGWRRPKLSRNLRRSGCTPVALRRRGRRSSYSSGRSSFARRWRACCWRALKAAPPANEDLRLIDAEYARTAPFARLSATDDGFAWTLDSSAAELDAVLRPLVESAVSLLTSERLARLRRCGSPTCYWLFLDETKNCSRRWCEMASCGNLMKVRRHRARQRRSV